MSHRIWKQYEACQSDEWPWFEESLTYANSRISQALLVAGEFLGHHIMQEIGTQSLDWLMQVQTDREGLFTPVGTNGFYVRHGEQSFFDQQPIEAWATISACLTAEHITRNPQWKKQANRAFDWFKGTNMLGLSVYDKETGGCHDGLHPKRVNRNQGAGSTLSYLCALTELRQSNRPSGHSVPIVSAYEIK
jgi:hypothetical protein